nr:unnamed protein product [Callosobruchus chinensis]
MTPKSIKYKCNLRALIEAEAKKKDVEHALKKSQSEASRYRKEVHNLETSYGQTNLKRIAQESPVNYNKTPRLSVPESTKLKEIPAPDKPDTESPYLQIKSNVGMGYGKFLSTKYISSKDVAKEGIHDLLQSNKQQDVCYNGLGGSSKDDIFPSPKTSQPLFGLKKKSFAKNKFKRLAPSTNTHGKCADISDMFTLYNHIFLGIHTEDPPSRTFKILEALKVHVSIMYAQ